MSYSEEALEAAARVGLLTDERRIDRPATVARIIEFPSTRPIASLDEVRDPSIPTIEEIAGEIFKSNDEELRRLVSQLCPLSANGPVQHRLNGDGKLLCGKRVKRLLHGEDEVVIERMFTGRFITTDQDVVMEHLIDLKNKRVEGSVEQYAELMKLAVHRMPGLAAALEQRKLGTVDRMRILLAPRGA